MGHKVKLLPTMLASHNCTVCCLGYSISILLPAYGLEKALKDDLPPLLEIQMTFLALTWPSLAVVAIWLEKQQVEDLSVILTAK